MKEEFVNPFLTPAVDVWKRELGEDLEYKGASNVPSQGETDAITAFIGVAGSIKGVVLYEFDKETAKKIVSKMVGEETDLKEDVAISALGELANMITGNAASALTVAGYPCGISPPIMMAPNGLPIRFNTGGAQIQVTFDCALGELRIRVGLTENSHFKPSQDSGDGK